MTDSTYANQENHFVAFESPLGGVMTEEVGAITGTLEVAVIDGAARIRYVGAEDLYTVLGTPPTADAQTVADRLSEDPGIDKDGNPAATSLASADPPGSLDDASA